MANTEQLFQAVFLTYSDVKQANPSWSDRMIEDYLTIKRDVSLVANVGDDVEARVAINEISIAAIKLRLDALESLMPVSYYIISDHTVTANETITCGNATGITVTLPISPIDQQRVSVKRVNAEVAYNGNGKLIDGETTIIINRKYTGLTIEYSANAGYWSII